MLRTSPLTICIASFRLNTIGGASERAARLYVACLRTLLYRPRVLSRVRVVHPGWVISYELLRRPALASATDVGGTQSHASCTIDVGSLQHRVRGPHILRSGVTPRNIDIPSGFVAWNIHPIRYLLRAGRRLNEIGQNKCCLQPPVSDPGAVLKVGSGRRGQEIM